MEARCYVSVNFTLTIQFFRTSFHSPSDPKRPNKQFGKQTPEATRDWIGVHMMDSCLRLLKSFALDISRCLGIWACTSFMPSAHLTMWLNYKRHTMCCHQYLWTRLPQLYSSTTHKGCARTHMVHTFQLVCFKVSSRYMTSPYTWSWLFYWSSVHSQLPGNYIPWNNVVCHVSRSTVRCIPHLFV